MVAQTVLQIRNVSFQYQATPILNDVNIEVHAGEIFGVIGPNGSGKTTLLRTINGLLTPKPGEILINGINIHQLSIQQRARLIASVPQARELPVTFSAWDVVLLGRTPYLQWSGTPTKNDRQIAEAAMQTTNTWHLRDRYINQLSGGEQQRLLLARAITQDTPILLLDEPITHLDLKHQVSILKQIHRLANENQLAVVITLHDLNWAAQFCQRIGVLSQGSMVAQGEPNQVLDENLLSQVYQTPVKIIPYPGNGKPLVLPHHF